MAKPPFPKFTAEQRESMKVLDAHMLRVARPFFWHIGACNDGVPRGATAFILRFERGYVAVRPWARRFRSGRCPKTMPAASRGGPSRATAPPSS